jgi:hypothetical protein
MDKYILKDGSVIEFEEGSSTFSFTKRLETQEEYISTLKQLNKSNLEKYQIQSASGLVGANPENKECISHKVKTIWDSDGNITQWIVTFEITDVDMINERLSSLEETTDILTANALGVSG